MSLAMTSQRTIYIFWQLVESAWGPRGPQDIVIGLKYQKRADVEKVIRGNQSDASGEKVSV